MGNAVSIGNGITAVNQFGEKGFLRTIEEIPLAERYGNNSLNKFVETEDYVVISNALMTINKKTGKIHYAGKLINVNDVAYNGIGNQIVCAYGSPETYKIIDLDTLEVTTTQTARVSGDIWKNCIVQPTPNGNNTTIAVKNVLTGATQNVAINATAEGIGYSYPMLLCKYGDCIFYSISRTGDDSKSISIVSIDVVKKQSIEVVFVPAPQGAYNIVTISSCSFFDKNTNILYVTLGIGYINNNGVTIRFPALIKIDIAINKIVGKSGFEPPIEPIIPPPRIDSFAVCGDRCFFTEINRTYRIHEFTFDGQAPRIAYELLDKSDSKVLTAQKLGNGKILTTQGVVDINKNSLLPFQAPWHKETGGNRNMIPNKIRTSKAMLVFDESILCVLEDDIITSLHLNARTIAGFEKF